MLCVRDCPSDAVKITKIGEKQFSCTFNLDNCIYCGQCADSCAKKIISMSKEFELATFNRSTLANTTDSDPPPPKVDETKPSSEEVACEISETPETKV